MGEGDAGLKAVVVGAGLAGLAAADRLRHAGADVHVFEARDRVGGRVWSVPFGGLTVERGAEFILPGNSEVRALASRLGLSLVRKGMFYGAREPRGVDGVTSGEVTAAVERIGAAGTPSGTLAAVLDASDEPSAVVEAIRARVEVSCAHPATDLDAAELSGGAAEFGEFDTYTVDGGNDRLAWGLAGCLGPAVHLSCPVEAVAWSDTQVEVRVGGVTVAADAAVIAVPASVTDAIAFDPPLPTAKAAALRGTRYGQAAKLFVGLREPAEPSATLSVPERFWCYTQLGLDGRPLPVVGCFAATLPALERLEVERGPERWIGALAQLRPDLELAPGSALVARWHDDPWARGAYTARSVEAPMDDAELARPVGALGFAGEHTAGAWHGLMEGALRSGVRAAEELLGVTV
jgi:monoamine oxidase